MEQEVQKYIVQKRIRLLIIHLSGRLNIEFEVKFNIQFTWQMENLKNEVIFNNPLAWYIEF